MPGRHVIFALICVAIAVPAAAQVQITFRDGVTFDGGYAGTRDLQLSSIPSSGVADPNQNYDSNDNLLDGVPDRQGVLFRCDVSALAPGTPITAVELQVTATDGTTNSYDIFDLRVPWVSSEATWHLRTSNDAWAYPGAAGSGSDIAAASVGTFAAPSSGLQTNAFNAAGVAMVQRWVDVPGTNHGLTIHRYDNRNGTGFRNVARVPISERPVLRITAGNSVVSFQNGASPASTYVGCVDTTIAKGPITGNYNGLGLVTYGLGGSSAEHRTSLLGFDVSSISPQATVIAAALHFHVLDRSQSLHSLREVRTPWSETTATWMMADATTAWDGPGALGAGDTAPAPQVDPFDFVSVGPRTIMLTDAGVETIGAWIRGDRPNNGWLIEQDPSAASFGMMNDREDADVAVRPALTLWLQLPDAGMPEDAGTSEDAGAAEDAGTQDGGARFDGGRPGDGGDEAADAGGPDDSADAGRPPPMHLTVSCVHASSRVPLTWFVAALALALLFVRSTLLR